jgi:hypothetical protein
MFLIIFPPLMLLAEELRKAWGRRQRRVLRLQEIELF